jgi:NADH-quinone oxidoreductase subunit N
LLTNQTLALSFLIAIFSMAGVPPLVGFYAKLVVFLSVVNSSYLIFVIFTFLTTVISSFFYLRLIKTIFFEKLINVNLFGSLNYTQANVVALSSISLLFFFLNPSLLGIICYRAGLY